MNLEQLSRDNSARSREFPVCEKQIFLAHAGVSPLPRRVADAMKQYCESVTRAGQEDVLPEGFVGETRQLSAKLLGVSHEEIAFTGSTSMGLATVAAGLDWRAGDNVVCYRADYPANVHPWMNLAERGVEVRFVEPRRYGNVTLDDVAGVVDARTRLVSLASVHYITGWRLDVDGIGQFFRERGILFCLDAIQSLGALETSLRYVDFAAADAHKWLLGPLGIAIFYVRKEQIERLRPPLVGAHSGPTPDFHAQARLQFWPDARRYEPGSFNIAGLVGLNAAVRLILEAGLGAIQSRVLALSRYAIEAGRAKGLRVAGPEGEDGLSGIVSFEVQGGGAARWHARLAEAGILASLRRRHEGRMTVRFSPHFYNCEGDIDAAMGWV